MIASIPSLPASASATFRALTGLGVCLLCSVQPAFSAERVPPIKVTTLPATAGAGPVVKLEGRGKVTGRYTAYETADNTTFDLTGIHFSANPEHPTKTTFSAGEQVVPPRDIRVIGGVVDGGMPREFSWSMAHAFGGAAYYTVSTGLQVLEGARIHNVEDGWKPRETPGFKFRSYPNTGRLIMRGCYMSAIRDDCIENDEFIPGLIEDSLFDGAFMFISEQNERPNGVDYPDSQTIGPNEDPVIRMTRVLVRLTDTSSDGTGPQGWFKLMGRGAPVHKYVITDCVLATDRKPRSSWRMLDFSMKGTTFEFRGSNFILWLGEPGTYGAPVPEGVTFVEGQPAKDKWQQMRNAWLVAHGYDPLPPGTWDPWQNPVEAPRRAK